MEKFWSFDNQETRDFALSRQAFTKALLSDVRGSEALSSALDVGCGVGDFSKLLFDLGFNVIAIDGREENAAEGKKRYPEIEFRVADVEGLSTSQLGAFDLVLCFGLLYHLENPFRAIRNLHSLTKKILLVESMCMPSADATMGLLDEVRDENQGLTYVAFYPSESCLVKMLYRAGFPFVYGFARLPESEFYGSTKWKRRRRTLLAASKVPLTALNLVPIDERFRWATGNSEIWVSWLGRVRDSVTRPLIEMRVRVPRFLGRPWSEKRQVLSWYLRRLFHRRSVNGAK